MQKVKRKVYFVVALFFAISLIVFCLGYLYISNYYIEKAAGNNFVNLADQVAVEFNLQSADTFETYKDLVDLSDEDDVYQRYLDVCLKKDSLDIRYIEDFKIGYIDSENKQYYLDDQMYEISNDYDDKLFDNPISFCNFSYILKDNQDNNNYVVYRYKDIILYFESNHYGEVIFDAMVDMQGSKYIILEEHGTILFEKDSNVYFKNLYSEFHLLDSFSSSYEDLVKHLEEGKSGFGVFKSDNQKKLFVYAPILEAINGHNLFICYSLEYKVATENSYFIETERYLSTSLLVIFITLFLLLNGLFLIINFIYAKKEYEFSLSRVNQVFVKPYSLSINKKGKIISFNKSFKVNVLDPKQYQNINDFDLYTESADDALTLVKKQLSFTVIVNGLDKNKEYIHFIPMKIGFRYCLLGENKTNEILESVSNRQIALYNGVTKLPNRFVLNKRLQELCSSEAVYVTNNSLVAIDIADFMKVNRIFGYTAADNILCALSEMIKKSLHDFEYELFNIRTSLFVVLIRNVQSYNNVIAWSKQCLQELQEPIEIKGNYLTSVDVRMGIFNIDASKLDAIEGNQIYDFTIAALDRAKSSRLTKCAIYSAELGKMFSRDQIMEADLRVAIEKREFMMFFQAQFNTKLNRVVGFETLVRWNNPKYRLESVEHFIILAEKNGMIIEIGRIIIEETFKFAKKIEETGIHLSLNVSPVQLLQNGFVNELIDMFNMHQLKKGSIAIEITETFLMENSDSVISKLKLLRENGFSIHLDDFGIGYSSMLYLKDLPIDLIKIDKQFVKEMVTDKFARIIVTKIVQIATSLDLDIIAEGVETPKQSDMLSKMGCNIIQGYLISKPVEEEEALKLIKKQAKKIIEEEAQVAEEVEENFDDEIALLEEAEEKIEKTKKKKKGEDK